MILAHHTRLNCEVVLVELRCPNPTGPAVAIIHRVGEERLFPALDTQLEDYRVSTGDLVYDELQETRRARNKANPKHQGKYIQHQPWQAGGDLPEMGLAVRHDTKRLAKNE